MKCAYCGDPVKGPNSGPISASRVLWVHKKDLPPEIWDAILQGKIRFHARGDLGLDPEPYEAAREPTGRSKGGKHEA